MPPTLKTAVWSCAAATLLGFVLPWAQLDFRTTALEKQIGSKAKSAIAKSFGKGHRPTRAVKSTPLIPTKVRGYQIPILANRKNVRVANQLMELFTKKHDRAIGVKSYAVYLLPAFALVCGWLLTMGRVPAAGRAALAILCAAVAAAGCWTLLTTDTRKAYAIVIGPGLWLSLAAYAGLAAAALSTCRPAVSSKASRTRTLAS